MFWILEQRFEARVAALRSERGIDPQVVDAANLGGRHAEQPRHLGERAVLVSHPRVGRRQAGFENGGAQAVAPCITTNRRKTLEPSSYC